MNEAVPMVGSQRLSPADCYLNGYTSVCVANVGEPLDAQSYEYA